MKQFQTLIKIRKLKLEELLTRISMLENHIAILEEKLVVIAAQMNVEIMKHENSEFRFALDNYLVGAREKRKNLLEGIVVADQKITKLKSEIHDEFGEMKKLEIALERRLEEQKSAQELAESKILDDINIAKNHLKEES